MSNEIELTSPEIELGDLVRTILVHTDLTDIQPGSSVATLLEAIARQIFLMRTSAIKILESTNLEALVGAALDRKAESMKLPNGVGGFGRKPASQALDSVIVGSSVVKVATSLYAGKPAPYAGQMTLNVEDGTYFEYLSDGVTPIPAPQRKLYIGRGTVDRFEGPISYSTVVDNGTYWTITLLTPLTKSHLHSDKIVLAQGGDRAVPAGTIVQVPASTDSPAVQFSITKEGVIPDGESEIELPAICSSFGEVGNVLAGAISSFTTPPFAGATVRNPRTFTNGRSTESDEDLRLRIKNYPATLSRGTKTAILSAILGATDPESGRSIQSAIVLEPVEAGDAARAYIDDGTGLEPTLGSQPYELLLSNAGGLETRFRASQYPITAAVIAGTKDAPFVLDAGMSLTVRVDDVVETYTITPSNYNSLSSATAYEIVRDLNAQSNIVGFRTSDGGKRIVMIDLSGTAETMSVSPGSLQSLLGLSTAVVRPIFVYKNSVLQSFRGHTATLETRPRNQWSLTTSDLADVRVKVDGVIQTISITDADFAEFTATINTASVKQWATVLSRKIAGVKFTVSGQVIVWSTWQTYSEGGSLEILETKADGSPAGWVADDGMWTPTASGGKLSDVGNSKDFKFNRFTGEINFINKVGEGAKIEIGNRLTRAFIESKPPTSGLYSLAPIPSTVGNPKLIVGFDGEFSVRSTMVATGATATPTFPDPTNFYNIMRLTADTVDIFSNAKVGDWIYLCRDASVLTPIPAGAEGFYRVKAVGLHGQASNYTTSGLTGSTTSSTFFTSLNASVFKDLNTVVVVKADHGLRTGDLITVSTTAAIGGISAANLSVVNSPIIVLDNDRFQYTALANATSNASGTLSSVGTNIVVITEAMHGHADGTLVNVSSSGAVGGISAANLTVSNVTIEVINANTYRYRAAAAATSIGSGTFFSITFIADSWVEVEVSSPQRSIWFPLSGIAQTLTSHMVYIFRSTVIPQLIDFGGSLSSVELDDVVKLINDSIAAGTAEKVSPQKFILRSNNYNNGTVAVLAVIGSAANLFSVGTAESIQSHTANLSSSYTQAGPPVMPGIFIGTPGGNHPTQMYLTAAPNYTDITNTLLDPSVQEAAILPPTSYPVGFEHVWVSGRQYQLSGRLYNNSTTWPFTGIMRGEGVIRPVNTSDTQQQTGATVNSYSNVAIRMQDLGFNNHDKLVVEMDLDPVNKTVAIPMYKKAKIQDIDAITAGGKGQVISFRLKDPENGDLPFYDTTSVYKDFNFEDFKLLSKAVGLYKEGASDRAVIIRSVDYGCPHILRFAIRLPTEPDQANIIVTHYNDFDNTKGAARLTVFATLPSQSIIAGSLYNTDLFAIKPTASGTIYNWRISAGSINSGSQYVAGNVLNIGGVTNNIPGSYEITSASYQSFASPTATTTSGSSTVTVTLPGHTFQVGDLINVSAGAQIGGISAANLTKTNTAVLSVVPGTSITYAANAAMPTTIAATAFTTPSSAIVSVTTPYPHGWTTGQVLNVSASAPIGGISAANLTVTGAVITVTGVTSFNYTASASATSADSGPVTLSSLPFSTGTLSSVTGGTIVVKSPGLAGMTIGVTSNFSASGNPIASWDLVDKTWVDLATALNEYRPDNPVITAEAIGTGFASNPIAHPTYVSHPAGTAYTGSDMEIAFLHHSFECKMAGSAGIWQYDSSTPSINSIKATVQHDDPFFPTISEAAGTTYSPINENVILVPTNSKTVAAWLSFKAVSSLHILSHSERTNSDDNVQISSKEDGASGGVNITGVSANRIETFVIGNATESGQSTKLNILSADAKPIIRGGLVKLSNNLTSEILRSYRTVPTGSAITVANPVDIVPYFRATTAIKYVWINANTARIVFYRNGMGPSQTEPLTPGSSISFTSLGSGAVQVTSSSSILSARVGDMMYINPNSSFPVAYRNKEMPSGGVTDGNKPEYIGYPVVRVIDTNNIVVLAPNIPTSGPYTIASSTDLVFMAAIWNEKNIRTNHAAGGRFFELVNNGEMFYLIKKLGGGIMAIWTQNSSTEATDDMLLDDMSVSTDDFLILGEGFEAANQGTFRIIAHNGRNLILYLNEGGGTDEIVDSKTLSAGGVGQRKWRVGPLNNANVRPIRILDSDSIRIGDRLRISGGASGQWFPPELIGSWEITKIGFQALDYTGFTLPHNLLSGTFSAGRVAPYIEINVPNAPLGIKDSGGAYVDSFLLGSNIGSIGFVEAEPFSGVRLVAGHCVSQEDSENQDVFLTPPLKTSKITNIFGTKLSVLGKLGFPHQTVNQGIDGYKTYTGLVQQAHRIIDGLPTNTTLYPGVKAAGATVEVLLPLVRAIQVSLQVRPKDGVTLNSITELVRATVSKYINELAVGAPVVISEIVRNVQQLPGVFSVKVTSTTPAAQDDRIVVSDQEKPFVLDSARDISVG